MIRSLIKQEIKQLRRLILNGNWSRKVLNPYTQGALRKYTPNIVTTKLHQLILIFDNLIRDYTMDL